MTTADFYDKITPFYDLIYQDWDASISRQASNLSAIIKASGIYPASSILDVSCGIGTQALGLAQLGFDVTASDLSSAEVERAKGEALQRCLKINFSVCDMRQVYDHHKREFDVVISADNSVPHLLSDDEILLAFKQFYSSTRLGGLCIITVRDYEKETRESNVIKPYAVKEKADGKYLIFQVWNYEEAIYETAMYCIKDLKNGNCETLVCRAKYYAISIDKLIDLMQQAGFQEVQRKDDVYFQPLIIGRKIAEQYVSKINESPENQIIDYWPSRRYPSCWVLI